MSIPKLPGEEVAGMATRDLFSRVRGQVCELEKHLGKRRNRDRAARLLTDVFVSLDAIARRVNESLPGFAERPVAGMEDEDDFSGAAADVPFADLPDGNLEAGLGGGSLTLYDLMAAEGRDEETLEAEEEAAAAADLKLQCFREMMAYMVGDCRTAEEMTKNVAAFARRTMPHLMVGFGQTQAAVGRQFGETRAAVQAREKRLVEGPLRDKFARGFRLAGGTKSEQHRERCRQAQLGNQNRRKKKVKGEAEAA